MALLNSNWDIPKNNKIKGNFFITNQLPFLYL